MPTVQRGLAAVQSRLRALAAATVKDDTVPSGAILGCLFLALVGFLVVASASALTLTAPVADRLRYLGGVDIVAAIALSRLPWQRLPRRALLVFPAGLVATAGLAAQNSAAIGNTFAGCIGIAVVYIGLTQPRGTTVRTLPLLALAWWPSSAPHDARTLIRLPMALLVWAVVGEVLAHYRQERQREGSRLRLAAETDPLTGVGNRRALDQALHDLPVGGLVAMLDLDHFKAFNDRHGHDEGDRLLRCFSKVITDTVRAGDSVCRYGGEEFAVVIAATTRGADLFDRLQLAWTAFGTTVTFSAGLAARRYGESPQDALRRADTALYTAKERGRDTVVRDLLPTPRQHYDAASATSPAL
jgi:diguanylate cyclase (GGDEF)-like protein